MNLKKKHLKIDSLKTFTVLAALVILGFLIQSCIMLLEMRRETWRHEIQGSSNLLVAEAYAISRTVASYDGSLQSTAALLFEPHLSELSPRLQQLALFDRSVSGTYSGAIRVIAPDGAVTHDSLSLSPAPASAEELDALGRHHDDLVSSLFITAPFGCDAHSRGAINLSRRIETPDGRFAGIVTGTIQLGYFSQLFTGLHLGPHDVVSLLRTDGEFLAHAPDTSCFFRNISGSKVKLQFDSRPRGTFIARSVLDNTLRVYTFTHLEDWPLVLDVGLSVRDLYAPWREKAVSAGLYLLATVLVSAALLLVLRRELKGRLVAEQEAKANEGRYRLLADNSSDLILRLDGQVHRTYVSPSCRAYGYEPAELMGRHSSEWIHPDDWPAISLLIEKVLAGLSVTEAVYRVKHKDGHYVWVEGHFNAIPGDGGYIAVVRDISRRKAVEVELDHVNAEFARLATIDALTGLPNRRSFDERFDKEWRRAHRAGSHIALLVIDVDQFKNYNDHYGHQAGDRVLAEVGECLRTAVRRPGDMPSRYGGEEFAIILADADLPGSIEVAERIRLSVLALQLPHDKSSVGVVSISIGVSSVSPCDHNTSTAALFATADQALYDAKHSGRNRVRSRVGGVLEANQFNPVDRC